MLVDFSANGSPYILSEIIITLVVILLMYFRYQAIIDYVLAAILCSIGLQVHSAMICIPITFLVFWLWKRSRLKWKGVLASIFRRALGTCSLDVLEFASFWEAFLFVF
jgi:type III secretory pathway component EscR